MRITRTHGVVAALFGAALILITFTATASDAAPVIAQTKLLDANGNEVGNVKFTREHGEIVGNASVTLPTDSSEFHGFHLHANPPDAVTGVRPGCVGPAFTSVGGHWDVGGHTHGNHTGDMPSLLRQSDGSADITFVVDKFTVDQLVGLAVIVHVGPDNFGNVPLGTAPNQYTDNGAAYNGPGGTALTGNAGARYACGVIEKR